MHQITILGSGTSTGVPLLTCKCRVCTSSNKKNRRLRSSALIQSISGKNILIDASPDFREQALTNSITHLDAVIITHDHADHTHGIDDLRPLCFGPPKREIPVYTHSECAESLCKRFPYIFQREKIFTQSKPVIGGGIPLLNLKLIHSNTALIENERFDFQLLPHGYTQTLAVIHSKMAYVLDCHHIPSDLVSHLKNLKLDVLILDCINRRTHKTHLSYDQARKFLELIDAKITVLAHLNDEFDYDEFQSELNQFYKGKVLCAFDGMKLTYS